MPSTAQRSSLDLLLITDEIYSAEQSRYTRFTETIHLALFERLRFSRRDAAYVASTYGAKSYLVPVRSGSPGAVDPIYVANFPHRPSLALCDLATVAHQAGHSVHILDNVLRYPFRQAQLLHTLDRFRPLMVGISTTLILDPAAIKHLCSVIRRFAPDSKIVIGGPTIRREHALHALADIVVFGSGEEPMLAILDALKRGFPLDTIPDAAVRDTTGTLRYGSMSTQAIVKVGRAFQAKANDRIPVPNWRLYGRGQNNVFALECSRGCKYNCFYCSYDRGKVIRPLDEIADELVRNARLGIRRYRLSDSNFTDGPPSSPDYPLRVCEMMAQLNLDLEWSCYARVDNMTPGLAYAMRRAGCFAVFFGVESADPAVLKLMRKGHDTQDAERGIAIAKDAGLHVHCNFIVGYPGETFDSYRRTMDFILKTRPDTVTLGQFFVEANAPVNGPQMREFGLQGAATTWRHATMNSETADQLIVAGQRELIAAGLSLGNEYEFAERMSLGLSFAECKRYFELTKTVLAAAPDHPAVADARESLRDLYLNHFAKAVAQEQALMDRPYATATNDRVDVLAA